MDVLFPIVLLALAFVILILLPARARSRMQQRVSAMQSSLTEGSQVMMTCGLYGTIVALQDDTLDLEVAPGVVTRFARAAVGEVTTPTASDETSADQQAPGSAED